MYKSISKHSKLFVNENSFSREKSQARFYSFLDLLLPNFSSKISRFFFELSDLLISKRRRIKIRRPDAERYHLTRGAISRAHISDPTSSLENGAGFPKHQQPPRTYLSSPFYNQINFQP